MLEMQMSPHFRQEPPLRRVPLNTRKGPSRPQSDNATRRVRPIETPNDPIANRSPRSDGL